MKIAASIPTRNRPLWLKRAVDSLEEQTCLPDELLVVDDSDPAVRRDVDEVLASSSLEPRLLRKELPNLPASRNLAADTTRADVILYIDDDVVLEPTYVESLSCAFQDPAIVGAGGVILNSRPVTMSSLKGFLGITGRQTGHVHRSGWPTALPTWDAPTEYLSGCNMAYRTEVVRRERFDEAYFSGYGLGEDLEFSYRIHRNGGGLRIIGSARLWHFTEPKVTDKLWGRAEIMCRPRIAGPHFSKSRFVLAAAAFSLSNLLSGESDRAIGNLQAAIRILGEGSARSHDANLV